MPALLKVLFPLIALFALVGMLWIFVKYMELKKQAGPAAQEAPPEPGETLPYVKRAWLLDHASEAKFFGVLEGAVAAVFGPGRCRVMVQMPLCRLVEVERGAGAKWQNKIDRKTVDYVVCEAGSLKAAFAVELDGSSHDASDRRERDSFVDRVLDKAGVKLVRIDRRGKDWSVAEVAERVKAVMSTKASIKAAT